MDLKAPPFMDKREWIINYTMNSAKNYTANVFIPNKLLSIITSTNKTLYLDNIFANYQNQNYPQKELIIILNNNDLDLDQWKQTADLFNSVRIYQLDESITLGECLNYAVDKANGEIIAKFDDDDYYGPNYLTESVNCFNYTDAAVVGKVSQFVYFEHSKTLGLLNKGQGFQYMDYVFGGTHVIKREVFDRVKFAPISLGEDSLFNRKCKENNFLLYAAGPMNYVRIRRTNKLHHAWQLEDDHLEGWCSFVAFTEDFRPYVTYP